MPGKPTKTATPDDEGESPLPITTWAVLGILSYGRELSGYDIKQWAEQSIAFFFWTPSFSQIYSELRRLEALGLAASHLDPHGATRNRRLYAITGEGTRRLAQWADSERAEPVVLKHAFLLRVWAGRHTSPEHLIDELDSYRVEAASASELAAGHAASAEEVEGWEYPALALRWSQRYYDDEIRRLEWLEAEIRKLGGSVLPATTKENP